MKSIKVYKIETERLILRCFESRDIVILNKSLNESKEHLLPWMPWALHFPATIEQTIDTIKKFRGEFDLEKDFVYGIFDKDEIEVIGSTGLHTRLGNDVREIGYWINVKHIKKGYAKEVATALTKVGFELELLNRIETHCSPENIGSKKVPEILGYKLEAT